MRTRSPLDKKTWATLILILVLAFWGRSIYRGVSYTVSAVVHPLVTWGGSVTNGFFGLSDYLIFKSNLIAENHHLQAQNNLLRAASLTKADLEQEVITLREKMGQRGVKDNWLLAKVLSSPIQTINDILLLDIGKNSVIAGSLKLGDKGMLSNNLILGQIVEIGPYSSKLQLYSASGQETPVLVGASGTPAVAIGQGSGNFTITLPRGVGVEPNARIYYASSTPHHVMGQIGAIKKRANNPFQTLYFRFPINFNDLDFVELHHD